MSVATSPRKKLCIVATVELPIRFFMIPHLKTLQEKYEITVMVNTKNPSFLEEYGITARVVPVAIHRKISLLDDFRALAQLVRLFHAAGFQIVHSITPKAGLLAMVAARLTRVPSRLHCFTGQVWANCTGAKRALLMNLDRVIALCATNLLTDSHSQRDFLIDEGVTAAGKLSVLANGSVCGVDMERFRPDNDQRINRRTELDIPQEATVCLYLGRITRDKGVLDLAQALQQVLPDEPDTYVVFVGPDEDGLRQEILSMLAKHLHKCRFVGYTCSPEDYMAMADILCLPSYREGFGMVVLEAAAAGIPALASRIYGITDAVQDGITGLLHTPGSSADISDKLQVLIRDRQLRSRLALRARQRVRDEFSQSRLITAMLDYYTTMETADETNP